jgi:hypothetical protein
MLETVTHVLVLNCYQGPQNGPRPRLTPTCSRRACGARLMPGVRHPMNHEMTITNLAEQINRAAAAYRIGTPQQLRSRLHGKRARTTKIFSSATVFEEDEYAFHDGGRQELQFNIGIEKRGQRRWWRHGVAFSFEASRSLPEPGVLVPKVRRFNEWVRANADALRGFQMWEWEASTPGGDHSPGEILAASVEREAFVFLGVRVPERKVDVDRILEDFDRLYPLYAYVESGTEPETDPFQGVRHSAEPTRRHTRRCPGWPPKSKLTCVITVCSNRLSRCLTENFPAAPYMLNGKLLAVAASTWPSIRPTGCCSSKSRWHPTYGPRCVRRSGNCWSTHIGPPSIAPRSGGSCLRGRHRRRRSPTFKPSGLGTAFPCSIDVSTPRRRSWVLKRDAPWCRTQGWNLRRFAARFSPSC